MAVVEKAPVSLPSLQQFLLAEFAREAARSRRALERVPDGHNDWKPHPQSMNFGYLTELVATMPTWVVMQLQLEELDIAPAGGSSIVREPLPTRDSLVAALDKHVIKAREALGAATADRLCEPWRLKARGQVVDQGPRFAMIQDTLNHWSHHRGQLTVYLKLLGAPVPALYGPSSDDRSFGVLVSTSS